jgi:hypothetical protein
LPQCRRYFSSLLPPVVARRSPTSASAVLQKLSGSWVAPGGLVAQSETTLSQSATGTCCDILSRWWNSPSFTKHPSNTFSAQTGRWCRCACSHASSFRTVDAGLSSAAAPAASDLTLEFGSFHPHAAPAPCRAGSYTTPPHRSASLGISHPATA